MTYLVYSLEAILTAADIPVIEWLQLIWTDVLLQGDSMYLKALNSVLIIWVQTMICSP